MFLKGFKNLHKALGDVKPVGKIPQNLLSSVDNQLNKYQFKDIGINTKDLQDDFSLKQLKKASDSLYSKTKEDDLFSDVSNLLSSSKATGDSLHSQTGKFFQEKVKNANLSYEEYFRTGISKISEEITSKHGKFGEKFFNDFLYTPNNANNFYFSKEEDIFAALFHGKNINTKLPEVEAKLLDDIGKSYKKLDGEYISDFQDIANVGNIQNYVTPINFDKSAVIGLGQENLTEAIIKHTQITDPSKAKELAKQITDNALEDTKAVTGEIDFAMRNLKFSTWQDEFQFGNLVSGRDSVLKSVFQGKEKLAQNAFLYKEFGPKPEKTISNVYDKIIKGSGLEGEALVKANKEKEKAIKILQMSQGFEYFENSSYRIYAEAFDSFTSAIFGGTKALLRQGLIDSSLNPASYKNMFFTKDSMGDFLLKRMYHPIKSLFLNAGEAIQGGRNLRSELNNYLHLFNMSSSNSAIFRTQGFQMQQVIAASMDKSNTFAGKTGHFLNLQASKLNEVVHKYSGNLVHYDSINAINVLDNSRWFTQFVFDKFPTYGSYADAMGDIKPLKYLRDFFNIGENEFNALRSLQGEIIPSSKNLKNLGFKDEIKAITPDNIKNMTDDVAKKYKRNNESVDAFKSRLKLSYFQFLLDFSNYGQVRLSRSSRIVDRYLKRGTFADLIFRPFTKFWNITNEQFEVLNKGISMSLYGSPFDGNLKNALNDTQVLKAWGKAYGHYMAGGIVLLWLKDLLAGRVPRDLRPDTLLDVSLNSGVGGIPASMMGYVMQGGQGFYGGTPAGSYLSQMTKAGDSPYRFGKFVQLTSGVGKLWWTDGFINQVLTNSLLDKSEIKRLDSWYKRELGTSYIGR